MTATADHPALAEAAIHLEAAVGKAAREAVREHAERGRPPAGAVQDVRIPAQYISGSGTLSPAGRNQSGPADGYHWDVRRINVSGFSAGTVTAHLNDANGDVIYEWSSAGEKTWSGQLLLAPGDFLVFVSASITGDVRVTGQAVQVADDWWGVYLL